MLDHYYNDFYTNLAQITKLGLCIMFSLFDCYSILSSFAWGSYIFQNTIVLLLSLLVSHLWQKCWQNKYVQKPAPLAYCSKNKNKTKPHKNYNSNSGECWYLGHKITFEVSSSILYSQLNTVFTHEDADVNKKQTSVFMTFCCCWHCSATLSYYKNTCQSQTFSKKSASLAILEDSGIFMTSHMGDSHSPWD